MTTSFKITFLLDGNNETLNTTQITKPSVYTTIINAAQRNIVKQADDTECPTIKVCPYCGSTGHKLTEEEVRNAVCVDAYAQRLADIDATYEAEKADAKKVWDEIAKIKFVIDEQV